MSWLILNFRALWAPFRAFLPRFRVSPRRPGRVFAANTEPTPAPPDTLESIIRHRLIAPKVRPRTRYFWIDRPRIAGGRIKRTARAAW